VAEWQSGKAAEWQSGGVAEWQSGKVAEWQSGRLRVDVRWAAAGCWVSEEERAVVLGLRLRSGI
jgi:hypothetical protein